MTEREPGSSVGARRRWVRRLAFGVPAILVGAGLGGLVFQEVGSLRDRQRHPPPGRVLEAEGTRLHIHCVGSGEPTIVLEAGAGAWSIAFHEIQATVAEDARTCTYDRAGYGWSEPGARPRDGARMAAELHALLAAAGEPGPYILAGASLGAHLIRTFRDRHPREVAGLVFVDGAHERQWRELPAAFLELLEDARSGMRLAGLMSRFGILRLAKGSLGAQTLHPSVRDAYEASMVRPRWYATMAAELAAVDTIEAQVAGSAPLGDLPVVVVSARRSLDAFRAAMGDREIPPGANATWMRLQRELAALSSNSLHLVSPEATHDIVADDPGLVSDAILGLVEAVRLDLPVAAVDVAGRP